MHLSKLKATSAIGGCHELNKKVKFSIIVEYFDDKKRLLEK
jgi:hypothetical protein